MQQLVHFNVGGTPFMLLKETIAKFPTSLLATLTKKYQEKVELGEYIYIDRHPKSFPWIVEILRDGDYAGCVPDMSPEALAKELKWYKLPLTKLTSDVPRSTIDAKTPPMSVLFHDIVTEIYACGLIHMLPLNVFVYQEYKDNKLDTVQPKVLVVLPASLGMKNIDDRAHRAFINALVQGTKDYSYTSHPWGKILTPNKSAKTEFWVMHFVDPVKLRYLNEEAIKLNMKCTNQREKYGSLNAEIEWDVLSIDYKEPETTTEDEHKPSLSE